MGLKQIGTRSVRTVHPKTSVFEAAKLMREAHVGALVVVESRNGRVLPSGMLTDRDIVMATTALGLEAEKLNVDEIMTPDPIVVKASDGIGHVIETMKKRGVRRLPIVSDSGELEGIVSAKDVLRFLAAETMAIAAISDSERKLEEKRRPRFGT